MAKFQIYDSFRTKLENAQQASLDKASQALLSQLKLDGVMPFRTGELQDNSTFVDSSKLKDGIVSIVSSTPYARRLYFNPQFNFNQSINARVGGRWFDHYLPENDPTSFLVNSYSTFLRGELGE